MLDVAFEESGPPDGIPVILLHGFPYSTASFQVVAARLAERGCRVIVPELRGHGETRFLAASIPRSGQQAAIGADVTELLDALRIDRAVLAGFDWGGRAACVAAALFPRRVTGLVSVNGYLIQDIAGAAAPLSPTVESSLWYQFYFTTPRGRAGLQANRRALAETLWRRNSPTWVFSDKTLDRHAAAFENPDYVDVVIHSYRHRLGLADGYSAYASLEKQLTSLPQISVPTITMDGDADGVVPATDGSAQAKHFTGRRWHRVVRGVGHNLPEEAPDDFAAAVWDIASVYR
ncbi:alpha/beta fold hydrolase [Gemmatimonas groenlandica]|uniref:alpha/beta fold hydrolase n=1 Tax=Gemmatimonas groenlandica TaxID=2732249 RepID=UPI00197EF138|nr:alpha/beta hydrolase [Gemmatimonas groenlandica]